jgi:endonuclease V-like protein UPF0215 family
MDLATRLRLKRPISVIGADDGPFVRGAGAPVPLCATLCRDGRLRSLAMSTLTEDGFDATESLIALTQRRALKGQAALILTDGLTMGGLNPLDLGALHEASGLPCIAALRRPPDLDAFFALVDRLPEAPRRRAALGSAGPLRQRDGRCFHAVGLDEGLAAELLGQLTLEGQVPEPLRLAHLIVGATVMGEPGSRA